MEWFGDIHDRDSREGRGLTGVARTANPTLVLGGLADGAARLSHQPGANKTIIQKGMNSCYNQIPSVSWDGGGS